jgi:hypothetical protein
VKARAIALHDPNRRSKFGRTNFFLNFIPTHKLVGNLSHKNTQIQIMYYYNSSNPQLTMPHSSFQTIEHRDQLSYQYCLSETIRDCVEEPSSSFELPPPQTPYYQAEHPPTRCSVRFALTEKEASMAQSPPPYHSKLTFEICKENWYQPSEISELKKGARDDALDRNNPVDLCGLERYSHDRVYAKKRAVKVLLNAQKMNNEIRFLREVSKRSSRQCIEVAVRQGEKIYHQVHVAPAADSYQQQYNCCGFLSNFKRKAWDCPPSSSLHSERRVRQRIISASSC